MKDTPENTEACTETRAESARVAAGHEGLDPVATKTAFETLDKVLSGLVGQVVHTLDQMIPHLAEMQALLSQRGKARKKVLKQAGLPSWSQYAREYAQKLNCSMRTIQDHIAGFRRSGKSSPSSKMAASRDKVQRLDARQQASLVKAQLAANDIVAALKSGGDWQTHVAAYEKVAVTPAKLDSYVNTLSREPDWKHVLVELMGVLEQYGDRLPVPVLHKKRVIEKMLGEETRVEPAVSVQPTDNKRYSKVKKRDSMGNSYWAIIADGDKNAWGKFETEKDADSTLESLRSPVVSILNIGGAEKKPPEGVGLDCDRYKGMDEGLAGLVEESA